MKIGNIFFRRQGAVERDKSFGSLLYDPIEHKCTLALNGFRFGQFCCIPFPSVEDPPYLKGDIMVSLGAYKHEGGLEREYMWVGWVWTESNNKGPAYQGMLEIDPTPVFAVKHMLEMKKDINKFIAPSAMYLNVWLEDK